MGSSGIYNWRAPSTNRGSRAVVVVHNTARNSTTDNLLELENLKYFDSSNSRPLWLISKIDHTTPRARDIERIVLRLHLYSVLSIRIFQRKRN